LFLGEKAFFFKTEMKISTLQSVGENLNGAPDMAFGKFSPKYAQIIVTNKP